MINRKLTFIFSNIQSALSDVSVASLTETTAAPLVLIEGESVAYDFDINIVNVASADPGNSILAVVAPSSNYELLVRLSDVDIGSGATGA